MGVMLNYISKVRNLFIWSLQDCFAVYVVSEQSCRRTQGACYPVFVWVLSLSKFSPREIFLDCSFFFLILEESSQIRVPFLTGPPARSRTPRRPRAKTKLGDSLLLFRSRRPSSPSRNGTYLARPFDCITTAPKCHVNFLSMSNCLKYSFLQMVT